MTEATISFSVVAQETQSWVVGRGSDLEPNVSATHSGTRRIAFEV